MRSAKTTSIAGGTGCRVITNSFSIVKILLRNGGNHLIIPGGIIYKNRELILDPFQGNSYANYAAPKAFIQSERMMIEHSGKLIILADSSKFEFTGQLCLCGLDVI